MPIQIHNKEYFTVAERLQQAHKEEALHSVQTEVLTHNPVVVKATVVVKGNTFTGISSVANNTGKTIEKMNPYEVAETSAVGRALGFAGYGLIESVASADEVLKSQAVAVEDGVEDGVEDSFEDMKVCSQHDEPITMFKGKSKSTGKEYWWHRNAAGQICFGSGYKD